MPKEKTITDKRTKKFVLRIEPDLFRIIEIIAKEESRSINSTIVQIIKDVIQKSNQ